jgi:hypothetical protein
MLQPRVVVPSCCGFHTLSETLVRSAPRSHFFVIAPVPKRSEKPSASFQKQTHRSEVPFLERQCGERDYCVEPCPYPRSACRNFHKASRPSYICALAVGTWGLLPFLVDSWGMLWGKPQLSHTNNEGKTKAQELKQNAEQRIAKSSFLNSRFLKSRSPLQVSVRLHL